MHHQNDTLLLRRHAEQVLFAPNHEPIRRRHRRRNHTLAQVVLSEQLEFVFHLGHEYHAVLTRGVEFSAGDQRREIKAGTGFRKGIAPQGLARGRVETGDFAAIAHQVNTAFVRGRRGHERSDVFALPGSVARRGGIAAAAEFDAVEPGLLAIGPTVRHYCNVAGNYRRGDRGPIRVGFGIEVAAGPEKFTVRRIVRGYVFCAPTRTASLPRC